MGRKESNQTNKRSARRTIDSKIDENRCKQKYELIQVMCILYRYITLLSDFINLTQVHNFTVSAQDIFTFRRLSVFTVSFTRILQVLMQIM